MYSNKPSQKVLNLWAFGRYNLLLISHLVSGVSQALKVTS